MEKNKLDSISRMTEEMRAVVEFEAAQSRKWAKDGFLDPFDRQAYLESRRYWNQGGPEMSEEVDETMGGPHGEIPFRLYYPGGTVGKAENHCIVYIHGGGFVVGSVDTHDGIMRRLADETGAVVAGLDYRLAPEYKFPVQIAECEALADYIRQNGAKYRVDPNRISLAGDSAGAYLSLASVLHMRDTRGDRAYVRSLLLFYGAYGLGDSMSKRLYGGAWDGLTMDALNEYNKAYANPEDEDNSYRNLFCSDLTYGIPPTYILACGLDPLLDDSRLLYEILREHGTAVKLKVFEGTIHAFLHFGRMLPQTAEAFRNCAEFYKKHG